MKMIKSYFVSFLLVFSSCSHRPVAGDLILRDKAGLKFDQQFDFSDPESLGRQIQKFGSLSSFSNQEKLVRMLVAFQKVKENSSKNELQFLPHTQTKIQLLSFCASPNKAIPERNEVFRWTAGGTGISLEKPVIRYFIQAGPAKQELIQELLWNLKNKTSYEDYPEVLREILNEVSPSAKIILPSKLRNKIIDKVVPQELLESTEIIEGKYYSYIGFANEIRRKRSKFQSLPDDVISKIPKSKLMASTESQGYTSQTITFYNASDQTESINLENVYLQSTREDVQSLLLVSLIPNLDEIQKLLETAALNLLGYAGSQHPTLNHDEKKLVKQKPIEAAIVFYYSRLVERVSESTFPGSSVNGESDAREFLLAHESAPHQPHAEREMDLFNNEKGISSAKELLKNGNFEVHALFERTRKEIDEGQLRILNPAKSR
ncbi:MAG: hypothetical protein ACK5P7_02670 [Bdellovibrio sp.]